MGIIGGVAGGGSKFINFIPSWLQGVHQDSTVGASSHIYRFSTIFVGDTENSPRKSLPSILVKFCEKETGFPRICHGQLRGLAGKQFDVVVGIIQRVASGAAKFVNLVPILLQVLQQHGPIRASGHVHILTAAPAGHTECSARQADAGVYILFLNKQFGFRQIAENHGQVAIQGFRLNKDGLGAVLSVQKVPMGRLGLNDGIVFSALQLLYYDNTILVGLEIP